jgi:tetratricopeptide (TPR) repeat protein
MEKGLSPDDGQMFITPGARVKITDDAEEDSPETQDETLVKSRYAGIEGEYIEDIVTQCQLRFAVIELADGYRIPIRKKYIEEDPEAYSARGVAYHLAGQIDSAIDEYNKALRVNPDFAYAHSNLGIAYYALGHIDRAVQEFIAAKNLDPELVEVHYNLGVAYKSKGEFDEAVRELQWILHADPDDADSHFQLGQVYEASQRFDEAIAYYRRYLNLAPPRDYEQKKQIKERIRQLTRDVLL